MRTGLDCCRKIHSPVALHSGSGRSNGFTNILRRCPSNAFAVTAAQQTKRSVVPSVIADQHEAYCTVAVTNGRCRLWVISGHCARQSIVVTFQQQWNIGPKGIAKHTRKVKRMALGEVLRCWMRGRVWRLPSKRIRTSAVCESRSPSAATGLQSIQSIHRAPNEADPRLAKCAKRTSGIRGGTSTAANSRALQRAEAASHVTPRSATCFIAAPVSRISAADRREFAADHRYGRQRSGK